ncbi:peptidoglycan-binding lysin domain protein [Thioploca ingrica]|uniref:Peptidoglycan-binding lysin domain protein n=1 Tax=Thioploca ingrica TaxID=40754 RepID=A0A090ALQ4_9GAMM|nr:peptidoglycan-binding lysin domain protein [Thioploca ingrica]
MAISQKWQNTVNQGMTDGRWDEYDDLIKKEVDTYNNRLVTTPNFARINWLYIKAILWTESGGPDNPSWKTQPMQIGNPGDPAYRVLQQGKEGANKIMDSNLPNQLTNINDPKINIKASIAYLFTRMAKLKNESILDDRDQNIYQYEVKRGDTLESIAKKNGTTIDELKSYNNLVSDNISPAQILKYRKAKIDLIIADWRNFNVIVIAQRYNGGGDPSYSDKLKYLLDKVFPNLKR